MPDTRYTRTRGGASVAYQVWGDGPPTITWFPALVGHLEVQWEEPGVRRCLERLGEMGRVVQFDKRGSGLSDPLDRAATLDDRMDDARAVLDAVGVERAFVGGVSEGGPLALLFAATYPERVEGLILGNTFAGPTPDLPPEVVNSFNERILRRFEQYLDRWGDPAAPMVDDFAPSRAHDPALRKWFTRWTTHGMRPEGVRLAIRLVLEMNVNPILASIRVPTLVYHVTGDRLVPFASGQALAQGIPGARFESFDSDDHVWYVGPAADQILDCLEEFITGTSNGRALVGRSLATVLFTDIVDSTATASRLGDADWTSLLDVHDELSSEVVEGHGGRCVKLTGDGIVATFDSPTRAIESAIMLRDRASRLGVELRLGLHTGEIELRGDDIGGVAVHLAARVEACAQPGDVLVSRTIRDLVAGAGFRFEDRGVHELKGIDGAWELSAVV